MASKKELLALEVAKAVGAGKAVELETVDFSDPNRPKTCSKKSSATQTLIIWSGRIFTRLPVRFMPNSMPTN